MIFKSHQNVLLPNLTSHIQTQDGLQRSYNSSFISFSCTISTVSGELTFRRKLELWSPSLDDLRPGTLITLVANSSCNTVSLQPLTLSLPVNKSQASKLARKSLYYSFILPGFSNSARVTINMLLLVVKRKNSHSKSTNNQNTKDLVLRCVFARQERSKAHESHAIKYFRFPHNSFIQTPRQSET